MIPDELAPVLLRHLVNVSDDTEVEIAFGDQILALRDGFDEDDPDAWGTGPLPTPPPGITVAVDPPEDPHVGEVLTVVGPAITVGGLRDTIAVEAGTLDLNDDPVNARVVWTTALFAGEWTTAGRRYIRRCVNWAIDRI